MPVNFCSVGPSVQRLLQADRDYIDLWNVFKRIL